MMKFTKKISMFLCVLTVLLTFSACGNSSSDETADTKKSDAAVTNEEGNTEDVITEQPPPTLPEKNYNGESFVILDRYVAGTAWDWRNRDIYAAELTGEGVNDAVYTRNLNVEDKFNVKIEEFGVDIGQMLTTLRNVVQAGDTSYDLVAPNFEVGIQAAQAHLLYDLKEMEHVNLDASYWNQKMMQNTSIAGRVFYAIGDISIMANDGTWIMMFNKQAVEDNSIENLYTVVREGKWTIDKFYEIASSFSRDLDGDGKFGEGDVYGLVTSDDTVQGLLYSTGFNIIQKDTNDMPSIAPLSERTMTVAEKILQIMHGNNITYNNSTNGRTHLSGQAVFEEGRGLFYAEVMQCVIRLREMEIDFGVLPFPKYDEEQKEYTTFIHPWASSTIAIPWSSGDVERSQIILEEMAYQSQKYLTPAYYDQALKYKAMRDEESSEMLDLILAGRMSDIGYISNLGGLYSGVRGQLVANKADIASFYTKMEKAAGKALEKLITSVEEYSGS
jgi:hypothetical protein